MTILAQPEAKYFCSRYGVPPGTIHGSFRSWANNLALGARIVEGTARYADYRDAALCEVERLLFLAASHYRRSLDLMIPSSSGWAHVTMYYGTFYAAAALMGMFGGWKLSGHRVLDVSNGSPGAQNFVVRTQPSTFSGSHRQFWDYFYTNVAVIIPWIRPALSYALLPINGNRAWLTDSRNSVNYDSHDSYQLIASFRTTFRRSRFPLSLPGAINTQYRVLEGMLAIATTFAKRFKLRTGAFAGIAPPLDRRSNIQDLILKVTVPALGGKIRRRAILG